jgi:hypothetical protein
MQNQPPNLPPNFNYYGQNPNFPNEFNKPKSTGLYALWVSLANIIGYGIGVTSFFLATRSNDAAMYSFILGLVFSGLNLIGMIVFISIKKTGGWVACLIYMLLFPLLGFFTCTLSMSGSGFH